jgi:hypothetical protein
MMAKDKVCGLFVPSPSFFSAAQGIVQAVEPRHWFKGRSRMNHHAMV